MDDVCCVHCCVIALFERILVSIATYGGNIKSQTQKLQIIKIMTENIELRSLNGVLDGEIEEYHEIKQEIGETELSSSISAKPVSSYEFFTNNDVKHVKKAERKKKHKRKDKSQNLMDIISSELAHLTIPVKENVIEMANEKEHSPSYLLKYSTHRKLFRRKIPCYDYEYG